MINPKLLEQAKLLLNDLVNFGVVNYTIKDFFLRGVMDQEQRLSVRVNPNTEESDKLVQYVTNTLNNYKDEFLNDFEQQLSLSDFNKETPDQLRQRIKDLFNKARNRIELISRTETNRAFNMGHFETARQSGLDLKKKWVAYIDSRTSPICRHLNGEIKPLDQNFHYDGKDYFLPPAHPHCRSRVIYIQTN